MKRLDTMAKAARAAMAHVLDLAPDDRVLVVTDPQTAACGEAFALGAERHGCTVTIYRLPAAGRPLADIPADLPPLLDGATVVVNAVVGDAAEVPFRLKWIQLVEGTRRIRLGHSPGIDEDMMISGALGVDYAAMGAAASALHDALSGAVSAHLTSAAGTDLQLDLSGRAWCDDLKATLEAGANLPCGEVYCAPVETGADGVLVVDGCFGSHGMVAEPVRISISGGRATAVESSDADLVRIIESLMETDPGARTIAELGIGLNPGARLTDRMLEAEKTGGTIHLAFGDNEGLGGGQSRSTTHVDYLIRQPTLAVAYRGGQSRVVMAAGVMVGV